MTSFEAVAAVYLAGFAVIGLAVDVPWRQRGLAAGLSLALAAGVIATADLGGAALRAWAPHAYLVAGYWIPGLLVRPISRVTRFEGWLAAVDRELRPKLPPLPAPIAHLAELAYLLCYPVVPASFLVVRTQGGAADTARFWLAVLIAGYACYVSLPWLVSRPPRLTAAAAPHGMVGTVNAFVLRRVSHQLNTFPSGHVAVSCAAAASLWPVSQGAALVSGAVAGAVAIGAAAGRYHYVIDVCLGIIVAAGAVVLSRLLQ